jgi:hypothetical protein
MERAPELPVQNGFWHRLVRAWLALSRRQIRLLRAGDVTAEGPALFAVSHPAGFLAALVLATAIERPVYCLLSTSLVPGALGRFLAHQLGFILFEGEKPIVEATLRKAIDVLARGGALVVFADAAAGGAAASRAPALTAAELVRRAEAQHVGRRVAVHPVHLFLPQTAKESREILIYVDTVLDPPEASPAGSASRTDAQALAARIDLRFKENAFQLGPAYLDFFLGDLEEVLRTGLQEEWSSLPEWKQDTEGFVLSRQVSEWMRQTNYVNPGRLVALRKSLDDYRLLQKQCALRELQVAGADSPVESGWRQIIVWAEMLAGLPIALYGLLNHLAILLVLFLARSFKPGSTRERSTEWIIRGVVTLGFYTLQIYLVAHWRGRAAAGYYAPTLPVSGAYLWRYAELLRPKARLLLISQTIPGLTRKIKRLRQAILHDLDQTLAAYEERAGVPR